MAGGVYSLNFPATASTIPDDESIPVLTLATSKSVKTASNCASISEIGKSNASVTATVFCAVTEVIADIAKPPFAEIALISACIPAPPPESEPAIVRICFILFTC